MDNWLTETYADPDERARVAAALSVGAPLEGTDPLDYAKTLGPDVAQLAEPQGDLPRKGRVEGSFDAAESIRPPGPFPSRQLTPAEDEAWGGYFEARRLLGNVNEGIDREEADTYALQKATAKARQVRDYAIAQGIDPATIMSPTDVAALQSEAAAVPAAPVFGTEQRGGTQAEQPVVPPPAGKTGAGAGGGFAFRGALPGLAAEIAKKRGLDEKLVESILTEVKNAADDSVLAGLAEGNIQAQIEENKRPLIEAQLANDLYQQSLEADVATKLSEDVHRRVTALDARMAAYSTRKVEDFDLGLAGTIGVALGGLAAAIRGDGGPNRVLALVERMIERDIDKQKFEIEKERQGIGMDAERIQAAQAEGQSELTRLRVLRAERWARTERLMDAEVQRYAGQLDQVKARAVNAAFREKAAKTKLEAQEALRADAVRSFAVQADALRHSERMWWEGKQLELGGGKDLPPVPPTIIQAIVNARVGLVEVNDLAAAQEKLGGWSLVSQYVVNTHGISYDDFVTSAAMKVASALNGGKPTEKDFLIAVTKMMPTAGDSDARANAKLTRLRRSLLFAEKEMAEGAVLGGHAADNFLARFNAEEARRPPEQRITESQVRKQSPGKP